MAWMSVSVASLPRRTTTLQDHVVTGRIGGLGGLGGLGAELGLKGRSNVNFREDAGPWPARASRVRCTASSQASGTVTVCV
jgi:hypothetical protein